MTSQDLASVQRLLASLTDGAPGYVEDNSAVSRMQLLRVARMMFIARKRRTEFLHRAMFGEPAYDMLLGLYVAEAEGKTVTATGLGDLAEVAQSSALRWIEYLITKELIVREPHPFHKRAWVLKLSAKGSNALEGVFRATLDGIRHAAT